MNKLKISILLMLYDAGEKGLTDKQIADRLDINKKGFKKLETALSEMKQHNDIAYKKGIRQLGDMPVEYFVRGRDLMGSIPGDIVLAKQTAEADERFSAEAVVVSVLEANNGLQTGVIVAEGNKLMVLPDKLCNDPLVIAKVSAIR